MTSSFRISPLVGSWGQLFDPVHGLVFSSPVTMVSFVGLFWLARRDRALAWYLGLSWLALFLVFATYDQWNSSHAGNRFLMPIVALAAIPLATLVEQNLRVARGPPPPRLVPTPVMDKNVGRIVGVAADEIRLPRRKGDEAAVR